MNKKNLFVNLLFILAILIIISASWGYFKGCRSSKPPALPEVLENDPKTGIDTAKVTIVEFGDFQCPYCKTMNDIFNQAKAQYGEQVEFVWKDFPLTQIHDQALKAAEAARCAQKQGKFWEMHDFLFQNQDKLGDSLYLSLAQQLKLDQAAFSKCLSNHETISSINQNIQEGQSLGVLGTPHFYINNKVADEVIYFPQLKKIIEQELSSDD